VITTISDLDYAASDETDIDAYFVFVDTNLGFSYRNMILYVTTNVINR
jgi:hypothetical protein